MRPRLDECYAAAIDLRLQAYELANGDTDEVFLAECDADSVPTGSEPPRVCA